MIYTTVFDLASSGYSDGWFPASGLLFVAIGAGWVLRRSPWPARWGLRPGRSRLFGWAFLAFAAAWTALAFTSTYGEYRRLRADELQGAVQVVEGPVESFRPMPRWGHAMERFCVQGRCFAYSDFIVTAAFHRTATYGGPIRAGLPVRVSCVGNAIVKLEVGVPGGA